MNSMEPIPRASVIMPHLNTPELLVRALQSLAAQRLDYGSFEVIVVDNGSRISLDAVKAAWPDVRFLTELTPGPGPARNTGVKAARSNILAFIDADVKVDDGWLQAGVDALEQDGSGPVGGDVRIDTGGRTRLTGVEAMECVFSFQQKSYITKQHFSVGANVMMTRAVFDAAGPFGGIDTIEDLNLGKRAYAMGMPTRYLPHMRVFHPARTSLDEMRRKWKRVSVQIYTLHTEAGGTLMGWRVRAVMVAISGIFHIPKMMTSNRVSGFANRLRGADTLLRIRWARAMDMLEMARDVSEGRAVTAMNWNR